jgi:NADH:ubiquinone oxidoreductase subunit F (NADH-binding)
MMISNTAVLQGEQTIGFERAMLLDQRDEIVALVKGHKQELKVSLERWCNEGRGSVKAMWQTMRAIGQGEDQIAVIDLQLESHCTS